MDVLKYFMKLSTLGVVFMALISVLPPASGAEDQPSAAGQTAANFLGIIPDPANMALGEAAVADITPFPAAALTNPARLLGVYRPLLTLSYLSYMNNLQYQFSSLAVPTTYGNIAVSLGFLSHDPIDGYRFTGAFNDVTQYERFSVNAGDTLVMFSYSYPLKASVPIYREFGSVGMNLKFVQDRLGIYSSESVALDVGAIVHVPYLKGVSLGASYRNIGSDMKFITKSFPLPTVMQAGLAYRNESLMNLRAVADYSRPTIGEPWYSFGLGVTPVYFLNLRAGLKQSQSLISDFRTGVGIEFGDFTLDYAFVPFEHFDPIHVVSLSLAIGRIVKLDTASDYFLTKHFREASDYYYRGDYIEARQQLEEILSVYPDHRPSQEMLEKIIEAISTSDERRQKKIETYLSRAQAAVEQRDLVAARKYFNRVLTLQPDDEQEEAVRVGLETVWNLSEEVRLVKERKKNEGLINSLWRSALDHFQRGNLVESKKEFEQILEIDPNNEEAKKYITEIDNQIANSLADQVNKNYTLATEYYQAGQIEDALRYFEAVVIAAPHRLDAQDYVVKCKQLIKEQSEKLKTEELYKEQSKVRADMDSMYSTALKYYDNGDFESALEYFKKSEGMASKYQFEEILGTTRDYLSLVRSALSEKHYKAGFELFRKNRVEAAANEYHAALEFNPENTSARVELDRIGKDLSQQYYEQGMRHVTRGEKDKAREQFRKSLEYDSHKEEARRALERLE